MGLLTGEALWPVALALAIFLLLLDLMHWCQRWAARYPPGPVPLPVLGNLMYMDLQNLPYCFYKLQQRFGEVVSLQMAWRPVMVLNGLEAVHEALVKHNEDTADRPPMPVYKYLGFGPRSQGVIMARYSQAWREQRRFSVSTLRNFGLGKKSLEQWVTEEAGCLCEAFADHSGRPFSPNTLLNKAVCNVISSLIYARRFDYDDALLDRMLELLQDKMKEESSILTVVWKGILQAQLQQLELRGEDLCAMPWGYQRKSGKELEKLRHVPAGAGEHQDIGHKVSVLSQLLNAIPILLHIPGLQGKFFPAQKAFMALLDELLDEHKRTRDPAEPPRDLTDAFLAEVEKAQGSPESSFNEDNLRVVVADLFMAGMVTTSTTLSWALLLMILHPDIQRRVQGEINEVIGQGRRPEMEDQARMPFTNAVIHEVQRFAGIVPVGVPHMTTRDIEVRGFLIPKGTTLLTNLSSVLKDERVWEQPFRFHPAHFLDAQGRFVKPEAFMPFSAGRRACLGEPLARMELFLFFTCLLQRFSFSVPAGQPRPSDFGVFEAMVVPAPYKLCAVPC
ncbi:cytochrome P450 2D17-like [Thomomys bottae]